MINKLFWKLIAWIVSRPTTVQWLIERALKTPYTHIMSKDQTEVYMERYWLFNPYLVGSMGKRKRWQFPMSIRLHKIMREDFDHHLHDHPWNARTIILRGMYIEERLLCGDPLFVADPNTLILRRVGDTATLRFNEYHRIVSVPKEGVWTMFITYKYQGIWGFLVDGKKVPHEEYLK